MSGVNLYDHAFLASRLIIHQNYDNNNEVNIVFREFQSESHYTRKLYISFPRKDATFQSLDHFIHYLKILVKRTYFLYELRHS